MLWWYLEMFQLLTAYYALILLFPLLSHLTLPKVSPSWQKSSFHLTSPLNLMLLLPLTFYYKSFTWKDSVLPVFLQTPLLFFPFSHLGPLLSYLPQVLCVGHRLIQDTLLALEPLNLQLEKVDVFHSLVVVKVPLAQDWLLDPDLLIKQCPLIIAAQ